MALANALHGRVNVRQCVNPQVTHIFTHLTFTSAIQAARSPPRTSGCDFAQRDQNGCARTPPAHFFVGRKPRSGSYNLPAIFGGELQVSTGEIRVFRNRCP